MKTQVFRSKNWVFRSKNPVFQSWLINWFFDWRETRYFDRKTGFFDRETGFFFFNYWTLSLP